MDEMQKLLDKIAKENIKAEAKDHSVVRRT